MYGEYDEITARYEPFGIEIPDGERPFSSAPLTQVTPGDVGWTVTSDGWTCLVPRLHVDQPEPQEGQTLELFGSMGQEIQGQRVDGHVVFWRSPEQRDAKRRRWLEDYRAQQERRFTRNSAALDAEYAALPPLLQARIVRFRAADPDFRVESEAYEMFACTEAAKIADALVTLEALEAFQKADWEDQKALVPGLADGHSGNTFGGACMLAGALIRHRAGEDVTV